VDSDTLREPRVGIGTGQDSSGAIVVQMVQPGSVAEAAGVKIGDQLLALGNIEIMDPSFGEAFRSRFGKREGDTLSIKVRRGADTLTLHGTVKLTERVESKLSADPQAGDKAARVRRGIFRGTTDGQPGP